MIEIKVIEGVTTALVTKSADQRELKELRDLGALWLTPASDDFEISEPLSFPNLRILYVDGIRQTLLQVAHPTTILRLSWLVIADSEGCLTGMQDIGPIDALERLTVCKQRLVAEEMNWISQQNAMTSLAITDSTMNDQFLSRLSCRHCLRRLDIWGTEAALQSEDLSGVSFPALRSLDISDTNVRMNRIVKLDELFPKLERLIARNTFLSAEAIRQISRWPALKILDTGTPEVDFDRHGDDFWDL